MREHVLTVRDALGRGLRPDAETPRNMPYLQTMQNAKPMGAYAQAPTSVVHPVSSPALSMSHPFPVLLRADEVTLLANETTLHTVNENTWAASAVTVYTPSSGSETTITGGGSWQLASIHGTWVLTNGVDLVFQVPEVDNTQCSLTAVQAVGAFDNRLVFGGMSGSWFSDTQWASVLEAWKYSLPDDAVGYEDLTFGSNWIFWSEAGGHSRQTPYLLSLVALGAFGATIFSKFWPVISAQLEAGRMGLAPLRTGQVLAIRQLNNALMVYGGRRVSMVGIGEPGYREQVILDMGAAGRGAVAGSLYKHVFVDTERNLRTLGEDGMSAPQWSEYLVASDGSPEVIVARDPKREEYWVSDGSWCYLLTEAGLGGPMTVKPTSLFRGLDGRLIGCAQGIGSARTMNLIGMPVDMERRDYKQMVAHQVAYDGLSDVQARTKYRMTSEGTYTNGPWRPVVLDTAYQHVSFVDGTYDIQGTIGSDSARVDRIDIRYQAEGRRSIRGTTGAPPDQ